MSYSRYPAYKASGVAWLGNAPVHWESRRGKFLFERMQRPVREADEIVTAFRDGTVTLRSNRRTEGFTFSDKEIGYQGIRTGDLVVHAMDGFAGAIGISDSDGKATPVYSVLRPHQKFQIALPYYSYLLRYLALSGFISSLSKGIRERSTEFRYAEIKELELPLFPVAEQQAIAAFLDRKTAEIDALIAEKERLLALLQEKRATLITQAVTKGLDPSAPMKESGVAWLGEIPAHWEVVKLGMIAASIQTGPFGSQVHSGDYVSGGTPLVNPAHIRNGLITPDFDCAVDDQTKQELIRHELKQGDIVFARRGDMGRCALVTEREDGWLCGTGSIRVRLHQNNVPAYIQLVLTSPGVKDWLSLESVGATMENLNTSILSRIPVQQPPIAEQGGIVAMSYTIVESINSLCAEVTAGIQHLQEYHTALISAAVTGKIDVRGA